MPELWPPPSIETSHLQWRKEQIAEENRAKDAVRRRPDGADGPAHPEAWSLWHLNYTDEYSSCFA